MTSPKCLIHYIICIASLMLIMGNSFAQANTATRETHLLVVGGGASDNLDTCENLISKNIYIRLMIGLFFERCVVMQQDGTLS